jgi:hypothetical protein
MELQAAIMPRNTIRRRIRWTLTVVVLALATFLFSAKSVLADDKSGDKTVGAYPGSYFLGPIEVHLVFTDPSGKLQDYSLANAPADFVNKLPRLLQMEAKLPLLKPGYFEAMWLANRDAVCKDVVQGTASSSFGSGYTDYDISCRPFKFAFPNAEVLPRVSAYFPRYNSMGVEVIPAGGYPTGAVRQLQLMFEIPANLLRYTMTTPCTCHDQQNFLGVVTCNKDPDFSGLIDVTIIVRANSIALDSMTFGDNPQMQTGYGVMEKTLVLKGGKAVEQKVANLESTLEHQIEEIAVQVAATQEFSIVTVLYDFFKDLFQYGIGGLFEMSCNGQLFHDMSMGELTYASFNSPTAQRMANTTHKAFKNLFLALNSGSKVGFTNLEIEAGPGSELKRTLIFKLSYTPAKPVLSNSNAAPPKKGIKLVSTQASINTPTKQVKAGAPVIVHGYNFAVPTISNLEISWNKTVAGAANSTVEWGPKGGAMTNSPPVLRVTKFSPPNLKPSTTYQFRVHECDVMACAPLSDLLTLTTEASGSNEVTLYLDNNMAEKIGTGTVLPKGGFNIKATIPANTTPGAHTINAATDVGPEKNIAELRNPSSPSTPATSSASQKASWQITVTGGQGAPGGGPGGSPTLSVMNTQTRTAIPPPINLGYESPIRLRGSGFTPAEVVTIHLNSATGPKIGSATPNKMGIFVLNLRMPAATPGSHEIVAVQTAGGTGLKSRALAGQTLQATVQVNVTGQLK